MRTIFFSLIYVFLLPIYAYGLPLSETGDINQDKKMDDRLVVSLETFIDFEMLLLQEETFILFLEEVDSGKSLEHDLLLNYIKLIENQKYSSWLTISPFKNYDRKSYDKRPRLDSSKFMAFSNTNVEVRTFAEISIMEDIIMIGMPIGLIGFGLFGMIPLRFAIGGAIFWLIMWNPISLIIGELIVLASSFNKLLF
jgi:hypothetical protein